LLREGLDIPEVSLVAILDADKEGFLRSTRSLIQTIGRASRNAEGKAILYADRVTPSMQLAMEETARRREKQEAYNQERGIVPKTIFKAVSDVMEGAREGQRKESALRDWSIESMTPDQMAKKIKQLEKTMREHAKNLEFEQATVLRDQIHALKKPR
jgi:excinuclease ABC subunit B